VLTAETVDARKRDGFRSLENTMFSSFAQKLLVLERIPAPARGVC
jgi:hypothetical protein